MTLLDRFLKYISIDTRSRRAVGQKPSSLRQFDLAHLLVYELQQMGLEGAFVDNRCFVYGTLPPTPGFEHCQSMGLIAHLDTHPDIPSKDVAPQIISNYSGCDIPLGESKLSLTPAKYPHLASMRGHTLITTNGTTLLGADDKAGLAEIMSALHTVISKNIPHGLVCVAFIPDEEIGDAVTDLDLTHFPAQMAYAVDGLEAGEIECENFNAAQVHVHIHGVNCHTGAAKGRLINAQRLGIEFHQNLPNNETPEKTEGMEGFYHLLSFQGCVETAHLVYNIRDFSQEGCACRVNRMQQIAQEINSRFPVPMIQIEVIEQYRNMKDGILPVWTMVSLAEQAARAAGLVPKINAVRGGTDGARLTAMGIPCPNLGTGAHAIHSLQEHISLDEMERVSAMLAALIRLCAENTL